ncbi:uncharacterized protein C8R40DRAFT_1264269 [Lentinula edodes]|uniref:uncharacterized protein n=1 Tax=Lentinula edodes TaxID=5353 RepID=UPI001E8D72AF|nr:uncharacterized protein C8R40DRAFT_1264269 [Lentinula edodes]KAH7877049.1 hypothetical protein C8R40DRAFT_1264269 [Lentinula edodes]
MTVPFNDDIYYTESIAGYNWPPKLVQSSTNCGDPLNDELYPPDFTEILSRIRSGYYPFGLEHSAYSNLLANAQINLDRCQNKLDRLVDVHETLEAHKQFLRAHITLISSLCSPIRKLPRELLEDIFEYVCCTGVGNHIAPGARYYRDQRRKVRSNVARLPTLDLGQVCHYWNSIICSLPVLWSSFGFQEMEKSIVVRSGLELFLRRSSSHPIDLLINEFANQVSEYSLPLLLPEEHSNRWRHVTIRTVRAYSYLKPLINTTATRGLPSLTSLSLDGLYDGTECAFLEFPVPCPNLQYLSLTAIALDLAFIRTTITHLAISHVSPGHAWVLISYCPNLKELLLKEIDISLSEDNALPLLYTCNAEKLILEIPESAISNLLFSIDLPKVSCLELIDSDKDSRSYSIKPLARMLDRSSANNLTHLSLRYVSFSLDHLLPLFSCTPSITDLEVVEVMDQLRGVYPILKLLICEDGGGEPGDVVFEDQEDIDQVDKAEDFIQVRSKACLLPKLENLHLVIRPRNQLLYTLVHSRWRLGTSDLSSQGQPVCLKSFYLRYPLQNMSLLETRAPRDLDALRRSLERFKKEGLNVQIGLAPSYNTTSAT